MNFFRVNVFRGKEDVLDFLPRRFDAVVSALDAVYPYGYVVFKEVGNKPSRWPIFLDRAPESAEFDYEARKKLFYKFPPGTNLMVYAFPQTIDEMASELLALCLRNWNDDMRVAMFGMVEEISPDFKKMRVLLERKMYQDEQLVFEYYNKAMEVFSNAYTRRRLYILTSRSMLCDGFAERERKRIQAEVTVREAITALRDFDAESREFTRSARNFVGQAVRNLGGEDNFFY